MRWRSFGIERSVTAHIHVETRLDFRHLHVEGLAACAKLPTDGARNGGGLPLQRRHGDRAIIDIHHVMAASRHVAYMHVAVGEPHMQRQAPPSLAMGVDHGLERRVETRLLQRMRQRSLLPGAIEVVAHVLRGAAAAFAEIRAERRLALG